MVEYAVDCGPIRQASTLDRRAWNRLACEWFRTTNVRVTWIPRCILTACIFGTKITLSELYNSEKSTGHPLDAASEQTRKQLSVIHILKTPPESTGRRAHAVWGTFLTAAVWEQFLCGPCEICVEKKWHWGTSVTQNTTPIIRELGIYFSPGICSHWLQKHRSKLISYMTKLWRYTACSKLRLYQVLLFFCVCVYFYGNLY